MDKITIERIVARAVSGKNGCLNWTGAKNAAGYGNLSVYGRYRNAHRALWIAFHGELPRWSVVCHKCDNPSCVNIDHLFVGRQLDNLTDMNAKGRRAMGATHGAKISAGWTDELRAIRACQTAQRMLDISNKKRLDAGALDGTKHCPQCAKWLPMSAFHKNAARHDGLKPYCKPCSIAKDGHRRKIKRQVGS